MQPAGGARLNEEMVPSWRSCIAGGRYVRQSAETNSTWIRGVLAILNDRFPLWDRVFSDSRRFGANWRCKANGAGRRLPTPLSPTRGCLFRRTFRNALGVRCLGSQTSWKLLSPALAPASGSVFRRFRHVRTKALSCRTCLPAVPRPIIHYGLLSQAEGSPTEVFDPSFDCRPNVRSIR